MEAAAKFLVESSETIKLETDETMERGDNCKAVHVCGLEKEHAAVVPQRFHFATRRTRYRSDAVQWSREGHFNFPDFNTHFFKEKNNNCIPTS